MTKQNPIMAGQVIGSSARFVSIDTHPANCSLVITYEVPIIGKDHTTGHEIQLGSKRDQFQVNISSLDKLTKDDLDRNKAAIPINIRQLSETIIEQYPVLSNGEDLPKILEELNLNLLYLYKRKQAQLHQPSSSKPSRPMSSTGSSKLAGARARSAARVSGHIEIANKTNDNHPMSMYIQMRDRYFDQISGRADTSDIQTLNEIVQQINSHLSDLELEFQMNLLAKSELIDLESHLEGLYGDQVERKRSMACIRRFIHESDENLTNASSNRLLVCAMLRTLRDCNDTRDYYLSKSILYCLVKFTSMKNTTLSKTSEWPELVRVVIDLLEKTTVLLDQCNDLTQLVPYYTNALLIILSNLIRAKPEQPNQLIKILVLQYGSALADILVGMLEALAKHMARYLRAPNDHYEGLFVTLTLTLDTMLKLVVFKEFILLIRTNPTRAQSLVNSIVSLINTLQLSRPGSGTVEQQQHHQMLLNNQASLLDVYKLELELIKLVTILIYDTRLKARLTRKSLLLKCVLRNLVVFLAASRKSNSLSPYDRSPVLMIPFRCLYELSCSDKVKLELFKSKIIMKCLLEYLVSVANDFTNELEGNARNRCLSKKVHTNIDLHEDEQIVLNPRDANHYILCFWLNLSARSGAVFYNLDKSNDELIEPIYDYLNLVARHLLTFGKLIDGESSSSLHITRAMHLSLYVHTKLLRNFSQYIQPNEQCDELLRIISHSSHLILVQIQSGYCQEFTPLVVECLATLTNFIDKQPVMSELLDNNDDNDDDDGRLYLKMILQQIFGERGLFATGLVESGSEIDDLLLVSINFLGAMARNMEICSELNSIQLNAMVAVLELKHSDNETLVSCLFTLRQLMNHSDFLKQLGHSLDGQNDTQREQQTLTLVDSLSLLVMHPDVSVSRLANMILNMLKQFEELYSLNESITCQRRFAIYNSKWLRAIKANRDNPGDPILDDMQANGQREYRDEIDPRLDENEDYNELKTIHGIETQSTSSSRLSTSSSLGNNLSVQQNDKNLYLGSGDIAKDDNEDGSIKIDLGEDDDEGEEETFSEPDLNVIDANSMIKHLTNRREIRTELLRR